MHDFNDILSNIGSYGSYQKKMLLLVFLSAVPSGYNAVNTVFTHYTPEHHCMVNDSVSNISSLIPTEEDLQGHSVLSSCTQYNTLFASSQRIVPCQNGWVYDGTFISVISEFDIVCSFIWVKSTIVSAFFAARMVSLVIAGFATDRFGRRPVVLTFLSMEFVISLALSFSPNIYVYAVLMPLYGSLSSPVYMVMYQLASEITGPNWRHLMNFVLNSGYIFGYVTLPLIAHLAHDWRTFLRAISIACMLVALIAIRYLPESPRWLVSKKDDEAALKWLKIIAKENKYQGNVEELLYATKSGKLLEDDSNVEMHPKPPSFMDCLRNKRFMVIFSTLLVSWLVTNITYYGLTLNSNKFGGNIYLNCFFAGIIELPSLFIGYKMLGKFGRPLTITITLVVAGLFCVVSPLTKSINQNMSSAFAIIGKGAMSASFYAIVGYTSEVLPTILRGRFYNICASVGKVGAVLSPLIFLLGEVVHPFLPFFIMGVSAVLVGVISLVVLPETQDVNLPETIEDVNKMKVRRMKCGQKRAKSDAMVVQDE